MLVIHAVGRDRADYYLGDPARELPVASPGRWAGRASAGLGLADTLEPDAFRRLLHGEHPRTGRPMGTGRVLAGFDLTFSAPKSASIVFALGGEETAPTVVAAHAEAVAGALGYLERHGVTAARRAGSGRIVLPTTGMIAATFTHAVNRNGDPHLHSHVVMANLVHGADGRWSACDRRGLDAHSRAAGAVYGAHLRAALSAALGVQWVGAPGRPSEIAGVAPELIGEFSSRAADIRRHRHEMGARSPRGGRIAWAATRPAKTAAASYGEVADGWARRARALGVRWEVRLAPPSRRAAHEPAEFDEHRFAGDLSLTAHGGAHRRDVVTAFGVAAPGGITAVALERIVAHWVPVEAVGVAEPLHQRRSVVPAGHLLRALGPRPVDPNRHEVWVDAAGAIDAYRARWGLGRAAEPLGAEPAANLAALPTARLADHLRLSRDLERARSRLGRRDVATIGQDRAR